MQALIPKATLLQGLRPNLNEGDHCVFPPGFRVGKILPKGGSPFNKQGECFSAEPKFAILYYTLGWKWFHCTCYFSNENRMKSLWIA